MKIAWLSLPLLLAALACQSTAPDVATSSDEPIAVRMSVGGVT